MPGLPLEVTRGHETKFVDIKHVANLQTNAANAVMGQGSAKKVSPRPKATRPCSILSILHKLACFYPQFCSGDPATLVRLRIPPYIDLTHSSHFLPRGSQNPPSNAANCLLCNCLFYRVWLGSHFVPPFKLGEVPHPPSDSPR